ncbi:MAG: DUF4411 family protein [Candidatus Limnocylindrales bacterium]|nr:DUF4411 family protein [Candidatus Limnocylindrales bacterium]
MKYCLDSSALIQGWNVLYPPTFFPGLWARIEELADAGEVVSSEEVRLEIERKDDVLLAWCKTRTGMFLPLTAAIQTTATDILAALPRLVDARTGKSMADPFVVATAHATGTVVVTQERPTGRALRPKIPEACNQVGVSWMSLLDVIKAEGWVFN